MKYRNWTLALVSAMLALAGISSSASAQGQGIYFSVANNQEVEEAYFPLTVTVCSPEALIYYNGTHSYTGGSGSVLLPDGLTATCDYGLYAYAWPVELTLQAGVNYLQINAGDGNMFFGSQTLTVTYGQADPGPIVTVATNSVASQTRIGATAQRRFTVFNERVGSRSYSLSVSCTGVVACGMSQPTAVTVAESATEEVVVSYSVSGSLGGTGTLTLTATDNSDGTNNDNAVGNIAIIPNGPIANRALCVATPAGAASGMECGALRVGHALPAVRTINTSRAPILTYLSQHAKPVPILSIVTKALTTEPDSVVTFATVLGKTYRRKSAGSQWPVNSDRRAIVMVDSVSTTDTTGLYSYTIEVRRYSGGSTAVLANATGEIAIVNRSTSRFGAGWWVAGVEQIKPVSSGRYLWIGGDGSTKVYEQVGTATGKVFYMAARQTYSDTLIKFTEAPRSTGSSRMAVGSGSIHRTATWSRPIGLTRRQRLLGASTPSSRSRCPRLRRAWRTPSHTRRGRSTRSRCRTPR